MNVRSLMSLRHPFTALTALLLTLVLSLVATDTPAATPLIIDFDGGDTAAHAVTSSSGDFVPAILPGGPTGNFMRLVDLTQSNNNSVAFDEIDGATGSAPYGKVLKWDFRMSADPENGSAADGYGIGYFAAAVFGATGPSNPAVDANINWERPNPPSAAVIGFDVYPNIDVVTLNFGGEQMAEVDVAAMGLDLNNDVFHQGIFTVKPRPEDNTKSYFSIDIIEDVHGIAKEHKVLDNFPMEFDLSTIGPNRVIAGGRTGGSFVNVDLDNISVNKFVPEPSSLTLLGMACLGLLTARQRQRN